MITVAAPNMMDFLRLCSTPLKSDVEQYRELTGKDWDVDEVATDLFARAGMQFVLLDEEKPIVAFGGDEIAPGVWETWFVGSKQAWEQYYDEITKACVKILDDLLALPEFRRIQTLVLSDRRNACNWYEKGLKMNYESTAKGFGVTGKDVSCYMRLKEQ